MKIPEIVEILTNSGIPSNEANIEVKMLIEHFCNYGVKDIIMGRPLDYEKLKIVKSKAEERAKTKNPIQYIIGEAYFMGNMYKVTKEVLIPRDETELVVRHALNLIDEMNFEIILDIGTGSGCIACSIALNNKNTNVVSVDISTSALNIAKENANRFNCKNIEFIESDLFSNLVDKKFDLIISNPPYIPPNTVLDEEVMYEPKSALFTSDNDGIEFYKKIIENSRSFLNKNGYIVFELGINQSCLVREIFEKNNFDNIHIEKDLAGIDRIISARKND